MISRIYPVERFRSLDRFSKMMDEMFTGGSSMNTWTPAVDVKESEKEFSFMCELPGVEEKDIDVEVVGEVLTITGHREFKKEENKEDYVRIERSYGSFQRSFTLDGPVAPEDIKANFKEGVLIVTVPKTAAVQPRKVLIHHN